MFRELCNSTALRYVVFVTNTWGAVSHGVGEAREKELSGTLFKPALDNGAHVVRHHDTAQSAHDIIRRVMGNRPVAPPIHREPEGEHKDPINTTSGEGINRGLGEQTRRRRNEPKRVKEDTVMLMQASKEGAEGAGKEPGERMGLRESVEKFEEDSERVEARVMLEWEARWMRQQAEVELADLNYRLQDAIGASAVDRARLEQEARKEREQDQAGLADLNRRLQDAIDVPAADRARLEQEIKGREWAETEHKQLADSTRRLRGRAGTFAALQAELEQDHLDHITTLPRSPLYVQVVLRSADRYG